MKHLAIVSVLSLTLIGGTCAMDPPAREPVVMPPGFAAGPGAVLVERPAFKVPGEDMGLCDPVKMREKALAAEAKEDWDSALTYWERVIDRCVATRAQRAEAFECITSFRPKVKPLNTDPARAKGWPTIVAIFKNVDYTYEVKGQKHRFISEMTKDDIADIHMKVEAFGRYVFTFSDGILRIDPTFVEIDEAVPLAGNEGFFMNSEIALPHIVKHMPQGKRFEHTLVYAKMQGKDGEGKPCILGAPYIADTGGGGPDGASFMDYPYYHKDYCGQPGEVELHEFLHPIDRQVNDVMGYTDDVTRNPDYGAGDSFFRGVKGEVGMVSCYEHVFRVRYTRLMWSELTQLEPKDFFWGGPNLSDWLALGPFAAPAGKDALDEPFIPEDKVAPHEGADQAGHKWTHVRSLRGVLDLDAVFPNQPVGAVAYLTAGHRICGQYTLALGANGPVKAFLNNKPVETFKGTRDFAFNSLRTKISFLPDYVENLHVFKVQKSDKGWKFQARVGGGETLSMPWGAQHPLIGAIEPKVEPKGEPKK